MKPEDELLVTEDIRREYTRPDPFIQAKIQTSPSKVIGAAIMGAHRGWQIGIHDAYKAIRHAHPEAARAILHNFNMNTEGTIRLSVSHK